MTSNNLSEQICKACGIEEQKMVVVGFDESDITQPIFKIVTQTNNESYIRIVKEHCLPDFQNNDSNFIKLMELDFDNCSDENTRFPSLWCFLNSFEYALGSKEGYLIYLLSFLNDNENNWRENLQRDVKCAIRQAIWKI